MYVMGRKEVESCGGCGVCIKCGVVADCGKAGNSVGVGNIGCVGIASSVGERRGRKRGEEHDPSP